MKELQMLGLRWMECAARSAVVAIGVACTLVPGVANAASAAYDGTYRGQVTRTRGDDSICGKATYDTSFTVVNGQFSIVYDAGRHVGVNLVVEGDGSFSGSQIYKSFSQQAQARASGRIAGNVLDAQIEGAGCARSYHLTKV
jgi:hypothetical protein